MAHNTTSGPRPAFGLLLVPFAVLGAAIAVTNGYNANRILLVALFATSAGLSAMGLALTVNAKRGRNAIVARLLSIAGTACLAGSYTASTASSAGTLLVCSAAAILPAVGLLVVEGRDRR